MLLRNYCVDDLGAIDEINRYCAVSIRYHGDVKPENVLCVENESGKIVGAGFLKPNQVKSDTKRLFDILTFIDEASASAREVEGTLLDGFIQRANEMKRVLSGKDVCLRTFCEADDIGRIQFLMDKGFHQDAVIPVMKYDLSTETRHYRIPDDVQIRQLSFKGDDVAKYVEADLVTGESPQSRSEVLFKSGDPSFKCFVAVCGPAIVGAASVWDISDERAATENVFVLEPYRRKNIARELLATAFDELKSRGKKIATLSVRGTNVPAIRLYLSCGYTLYYNLVEMVHG